MTRKTIATLILIGALWAPAATAAETASEPAAPKVAATAPETAEVAPEPFPELPEHHWARSAIESLESGGVLEGRTDGSLDGGDDASRDELLMLLERYLRQ